MFVKIVSIVSLLWFGISCFSQNIFSVDSLSGRYILIDKYSELNDSTPVEYLLTQYEFIPKRGLILLDCTDSTFRYSCCHDTLSEVDTFYTNSHVFMGVYHGLINQCAYFYNEKHGWELEYYTFNEFATSCEHKRNRIKFEGKWKYGKKHGIWKYYPIDGETTIIEKYRRGKLIRKKTLHNTT